MTKFEQELVEISLSNLVSQGPGEDCICLGDEAHRGLGMGGRDRGSKEGGRGRVY